MPHDITAASSRRCPHAFRDELLLLAVSLLILGMVYYLRVAVAQPVVYDLGGGDAAEYDILATHLVEDRGFDHIIFGLRPPLLPVFFAGIYALTGREPYVAVFFNLILGALTAPLTYKLALRLLRHRAVALLAGLFVTADLAFIEASVTMMSEPLHNFLLIAALFWLTVHLQTGRRGALLATALLVSLALLTRPITVYFAPVLAATILLYRPREWRRSWQQAAALVALCAVPVLMWSFRNLHYRGSFSFSTSGPFTMLYYKAVSVESHATGRDPNEVAIEVALEVERRMGNTAITRADVEDFPVGRDADRFTTSAERERLLSRMALERLRAYPVWAVVMTGVSLVRQFIPSVLPVPLWLQWAQIILYLLLGLAGYVYAWRRRERFFLLLSQGTIVYYLALPALSHAGLYTSRYRTPYIPFIAMFAALGVEWLYAAICREEREQTACTGQAGAPPEG